MTTKTYENMTVTVSCKEKEYTEMMELIKRMNDTKAAQRAYRGILSSSYQGYWCC